jgi:uncharacterized protein YfdQ (DUF2303 family)
MDTPVQPVYPYKEILEQAHRMVEPVQPPPENYDAAAPCVVIPQGYTVASLPWKPNAPSRIERTMTFTRLPSFLKYVAAFGSENSLIQIAGVAGTGVNFTAFLDYHSPDQPSWCSHQCNLLLGASVNRKRWETKNAKQMTQEEFGLFLEDNMLDIVEPDGATLLGIINTLEISGSTSFSKIQRSQSGTVRMAFTNEQTAKSGELELPQKFDLLFPVFDGFAPFRFEARIRYRLSREGALSLWYELINPHTVILAAIESLVTAVEEQSGVDTYASYTT